jgi:hypothetical protein
LRFVQSCWHGPKASPGASDFLRWLTQATKAGARHNRHNTSQHIVDIYRHSDNLTDRYPFIAEFMQIQRLWWRIAQISCQVELPKPVVISSDVAEDMKPDFSRVSIKSIRT